MKTRKNHINRLSKYRSVLYNLKSIGFARIFSNNLADALGVSPSQVRKDFSLYGITGNKKGGYTVNELIEKLNDILGKTNNYKVVLVGVGKIGTALINYNGFKKVNIEIVAAFEKSFEKIGKTNNIDIYPLDNLESYVKENKIKIGIIATPASATQEIYELMANTGIEGILNFAPLRLKSSDSIIVNNVDLVLELENLIYFVNEARGRRKEKKDL